MNKKLTIFQVIYLIIIILGVIIPFIDSAVVVEMFFLILPFGIILFLSLIIFIINLIKYKKKILEQTSTKLILIIPLFLFAQITSCFLVDKFQNFRSERIINLLEKNNEIYPDSLNTSFGIEYKKVTNENQFVLKYSRGFMVDEKYNSKNKMWRSYGWKD